MADALIWLLLLELTALAGLPWAFLLFRFLPDRGLTLAKPATLLVFSYALWVMALSHIWPNTQITAWAILLVVFSGSIWLWRRRWSELRDFLRRNWQILLTGELIFIAMFALWTFVVSGSPAITHTEKPMDFMLLNAAHQTRYFPAEDLWLSGHSISYYYFGHIVIAFLTNLTGAVSSTAYNLGIATIPALAASTAFGLLYNLVRLAGGGIRTALAFGAAAPASILLAGNLAGALELVRLQGWAGEGFWEWAAIKGLDAAGATGGVFPQDFWWWFRATRVIDTLTPDGVSLDYTITEFPVFSFVLGDLHAHVLSIPFLLLAVAAMLNAFLSPKPLGWAWPRHQPEQAAILALTGGVLAFINFWDFPTFLALLGSILILKAHRDNPDSQIQAIVSAITVFLPLLGLSLVMFLPFYFGTFSGQASGILPLQDVATRPFLLFIALGLFICLSLALLAKSVLRAPRPEPADAPMAAIVAMIAILPIGIWVATGFMLILIIDGPGSALDDLGKRLILAGPGAIIVAVAGYCALALARRGSRPASAFVLVLMALAFYLLLGAELFHIVDSFGGAWRRMNTVFKLYFQAWLLLGIVASFALYVLWPERLWPGRAGSLPVKGWLAKASPALGAVGGVALALLLAASFYYTAGAILDRSAASAEGRTLDGLAFLKDVSPGEYAAIQWLRDEAEPGRIIEAVGDDYTEYSRISAATGRPAVLGWKGHEVQWRGSYEAFAGREEDIAAIYSEDDPAEARRLLEHYGVRYVYLGHRERHTYGSADLSQYSDFLKTVFNQDGVIIYEMLEDTPIE